MDSFLITINQEIQKKIQLRNQERAQVIQDLTDLGFEAWVICVQNNFECDLWDFI